MIWDDFLEYQDAKNKPIRHYFIKATKHTKYAALDVEGEVYVDNLFHDESLETVDPRALRVGGDTVIGSRYPRLFLDEDVETPVTHKEDVNMWKASQLKHVANDEFHIAWLDFDKDLFVFGSKFGVKYFMKWATFQYNFEMSVMNMADALQPHLGWAREAKKIALLMEYLTPSMVSLTPRRGDSVRKIGIDESFKNLEVVYLVVATRPRCQQDPPMYWGMFDENGFVDFDEFREIHGQRTWYEFGEPNCRCDQGVCYLTKHEGGSAEAFIAANNVYEAEGVEDDKDNWDDWDDEDDEDYWVTEDGEDDKDDSDTEEEGLQDRPYEEIEHFLSNDNEVARFMQEALQMIVRPGVEVKLVVDPFRWSL